MKKMILSLFVLLLAAPAWAVTVKNVSSEPVTFGIGSYKTTLAPGESAKIDNEEAEHPFVRNHLRAGRLVKVEEPLTLEDCETDDHEGYCYMDVAVQNKNTVGCAYYDMWSSAKECLYYVDKERKLTERDCWVFDPGSELRKSCEDYVKAGIPSAPDRRYEESLKLERS